MVKNTGSLVFLSLWVPNKNNPEGFRKIITGIDQPRLVFFVSCDFSCDFTKLVVKTGDLSLTQLILGITDLIIASEGIVNVNT